MAFGKNNQGAEEESAPKKADVLLRGTQEISYKQDEIIRQSKLSVSRIDAALELFSKNIQDTAYLAKQSSEIFSQLKAENSSLKQELLYLAKQGENIYSGLSDKISELAEQAKNRENAYGGLADKINDVSEQTRITENAYGDISDRITELSEQTKRGENVYAELAEKVADLTEQTKRSESAYADLADKIDMISAQTSRNENLYSEICERLAVISDRQISGAEHITEIVDEPVITPTVEQVTVQDTAAYERLADRIEELYEQLKRNDAVYSELSEKIDVISERVERGGNTEELYEQVRRNDSFYSVLTDKLEVLSSKVERYGEESAARAVPLSSAPAMPSQTVVREEIDYNRLAEKIADIIATREVISPDYIASKVAEQVVIPGIEGTNVHLTVDEEKIARQVADLVKLNGIDVIRETVVRQEASPVASAPVEIPAVQQVSLDIDEEELADRIALKVGSLKAEDFEIIVDDEGCESISKEIADKLDYETISSIVAEKIRVALDIASANEPDYEEMAQRISEKITVAGVNEDAIAEKAAAVLSNYLPEFDTDDIADKVTNAVIDVVNAQSQTVQPVVDNETICNTISERLIESQADNDYAIVIDEEGISKITELVTEEIEKETAARFDKVDGDIAEIKDMLSNGVVVAGSTEIATSAAAYDDTAVEELIKVSDLVQPEDLIEEKPKAKPKKKVIEPEEEEEPDYDDDDEFDPEDLAEDELMPGEVGEGVDFSNMMRYNRSFIARIIQGTSEQKQYYGDIKHALLSYKKVNSNIAWGAERFNKGRETIARLKIRGKTLCLYLALDPNEYKTSVYHHADVSDNKSMNGTPMMVKIKSGLGVRKAVRLIDEMLAKREGVKREIPERDYAAMYPYETIDELIEDGLIKDVSKKRKK